MHGITRFNANGQTFDIPETETPNFLKDAPNAQRTRRFTAGGNTYDIPDGEAEAFLKDAPDAVETRTIGYRGADGTDQTVDVPLADLPKFLRRYNADETFAHDRERTRKNIAAQLPKSTDESPLWAGVKAFGEGLVRAVTDSANLWRETYGDGPMTDALLGANANANKIVNGILGIPEDIESVASMAAGGENTAAGKWLKEDAKAGRAYLESLHPTRISNAVGREDWGTIAGDKIGDISATIIKFAAGDKDPTKLFNPLVVSSAAADSYAQTYDNAIAHGKSVEDANYLANGSAVWNALMTMFMMRAFKGEMQAVPRDLGTGAKAVLKREATQMAKTGNVMGVQTAGNKAIETNAEGRNATAKELATAYAEGLGEGALFHSVNALGAQISEYGHNAERRAEWVNEFRDHILNSQSDRELYLKTPMGEPMRAICESVQNGTLPDRKAFVSAGIPKELCKTEAQRREIAQNFIETIGITADAKNARAAQNVLDIANAMGEGDPISLNAYREWRDIIEANSVPKDVRLWNGKKIVAERVDMVDGKFGYDIYHDAGDGMRQLITTSDEPLLLDAYADAKTDMMNYFGLEAPKKPGLTAEPRKLREQIEDDVKPEEPAKETKNEEPNRDHPQAVVEPVSGKPAPAEAGKRDEGVAAGDGADAASPRGTAETVAAPETPAPSAEATLERGAQDALAAALEAVKPTAKKRPGKVAAKTETPNDWRTMKVDEVDADGKPLTDDDKMVLRQSKVLSGMHDTWHDTSRKNFDAYVKLFDEVEAARDFGKTSAGDSGLMDARKVARDLALSKFATPEEVARFKKYYEGEPTAEEPVAQEPSKTTAEPSAAKQAQSAEPTAPTALAKPQNLNLNAESIRRANDVSMSGASGDVLAKDAQAMYESGLKKLADTDGMTPEEKAQAAIEREQWKALVENAYNDMIARRANWVSPAVAGPAKYNTRKWGKRQDAMITAGNEWQAKMERFIENAGKRIREAAPEQVQIDRIRANGTDEAINSGDANAAAKIQAKIDNLRAEQERMKAMNAWFRQHKTMVGFEGLSDGEAHKMDAKIANAYSWEKVPAPDYLLKNNGANIRRLEKRLDEVKANAEKAAEATPTESAWGTVTENAEANRLQVDFGGTKPPQDVINLMKHNGFKWSPKNGVWQRQLTDNARRTMERIKPDLDKLFGVDADKAAKAEAFNAPAFEVGANGEKVAIGPKAEPIVEPALVAPKRRPGKKAETAVKRTAPDTTALRDEIAKAKQAKGGGTHEVTIGTTTIKFNNTKESIAVAEKMLKKLETVKDWSYKEPSNSVPSEPKPLTVASGKKVGGFKDVSPDFFGGKNEHREVFKKPIIKNGYIYATDGRMIIRMKNDGVAKDTESQIDVSKAYSEAEKLPVFEAFKMDVSKENIALEQAKSALTKDVENPSIELWRAPDGKIVMRSRNTEDTEPSSTAFVNVDSLAGHDFIGSYNPDYLTKVFKTFTKLGAKDVDVTWNGPDKALRLSGGGADVLIMPMRLGNPGWTDTKVQLFGGRRRMTDAERAQAVDAYIKSEQEYAKQNDPNITKAALNKIESDIRRSEANDQALIAKHNGKLDPLYSRRGPTADAAKLDDPAFREWSAKRGTKADDAEALQRDRIAYDLDQATDAAKRTGNWLGVKVVRETNADALPTANAKPIREGGQVVGWYDPATKEVHLKPGADAKTVAHEVGWHATYDWAKANHPALAKTMEQYAANAPESLKAEIKKLYGRDLTPAELIEEIGAGRFEREHGKKLQKLLADRANRTWYRKMWDGIKDAYKAVLTKLGFNRVDLDAALKDKTPEQAMDFLASALARGKALGKMRPGKAREGARPMAAITPVGPVGPVDPQTKLNKKELLVRSIKDSDIALRKMDELDGRYANGDYADNSIHLAKKLLPGDRERAIHRRDFYEQSIAKIMREHKITVNDIDDYLLSVAVPERNARLAAKGITDGAGLTDADAAALDANLRATLTSAQYAQVQRCAHILWAMQQEGMAARIASGRVAQDVYDTWNAAEPHHIPMRTDRSELADIDAHNYSTGGYKRNDFMTAKGRRTRASSPTAFIFDEYTDARLSSLDNDLRVKLADFVRQHPEIGKIAGANRADNGYVILNGESGSGLKIEPKREQYGHRPQKGEDPNLILFKEGGILKAIELNGDFGTQIADAITDRQIWDFSGWGPEVPLLKFGAKDATGKRHFVQKTEKRAIGDWLKSASSAYASTATRWSPTFMARNFVKDQIELNLQNLAEYGFVGGAKAAKNQLVNSIGSVREINRYLGSKEFDTSTEEGKWLKRYVEAGGLIGGAGSEGYTEFKRRFDGFSQATEKGKARKIVDAIVRANEISEMMNRLANFRTACENGMGDRQAALKSRNDSVDFNSFGRAKWMNTVWNFSNSVTGGTMRQAYYLSRKHGRKLAASLFAYGFAEGLAEVLMNMDDDERETEGLPSETSMSEYQRANAAYVRRGDKFYRLPIHAGIFSTFKYAGNGAARMMFGKLNWEEYANALYGEARDTLKHFTGTGDVAGGDSTIGTLNIGNRGGKFAPLPNLTQSFSPSMLQGPVQRYDYGPNSPIEAGTGLTFAGTPLRDRSFNQNEPQAYNGREMTAAPYKWAAQALNAMSGGNEHRKGNWDMAPEDIKVITESLGKNVLKDAANAVNLLSLLTKEGRADFRVGNIPFVGDFVRNVPENDTRYYAAMDRLSADQNEYKNLQGAEKQAFGRSHKLVNRTSHPTYDKKGRITGFAEDKTEAERLVDQIKDERNLVRSGKIEESNPVYDRRGKIVRFRHDKVEHAYTPDEREQAERTRRKKQAKFIRLTREDDASK